MTAVLELMRVRLLEVLREPEALFWMFIFPVLMAVALAIAFPARTADTVVAGVVRGPESGAVTRALGAAPGVTVRVIDPHEVDRVLQQAAVQLVIEPGSPPRYVFDPARPESRLARRVVDDALQRAAGRRDPLPTSDVQVAVAGSRYVDWLVPGLLGMTIMSDSLWGVGFSIVQARSRKLLKRLVATPMRRSDYLLGQALARLLFLVFELGVLLTVGHWAFGVPIRGPWWSIVVVSVLGALGFAGIGLLAASRARTVEALSGLLNFILLPMWIVSGVFFASSNFPDAVQPLIQALPLTALNDALRAVMLEGAGLRAIATEILILAAWGGLSFALAVRLFRWR
jgi:ABC-2 type transport system permease protein